MLVSVYLCILLIGLSPLVDGQRAGNRNGNNRRNRRSTTQSTVHRTNQPTGQQTNSNAYTNPLASWLTSAGTRKPNVLFLVADDLRPWLGCYGESFMVTPNIDQLAAKSVRFDRAYVQQGVCGPSRASFMTGRRPDTTRVLDLETYFRTAGGDFTTVAQYFKEHGYITEGIGKIFHPGRSGGSSSDFPYSWSTRFDLAKQTLDVGDEKQSSVRPVREVGGKLGDTMAADGAIRRINNYATQPGQRPFFLAVGFKKPHLPFMYPTEYQSLYSNRPIPLANHRDVPTNVPDFALQSIGELDNYDDIANLSLSPPGYRVPDYYQTVLRKNYAAAVSYMDAQLGRVLAALNASGLASNTIISFHSDHGFQLGENGEWCKHNNYEATVRAPMLLHVPSVTGVTPNSVTARPVEMVDLFPTLAELAGLPVPQTCPENSTLVKTCVEGSSLVPLISEANGMSVGSNVPWKDVAFSQYPRKAGRSSVMGYTLRTKDYRYTEWVGYDSINYRPVFSNVYGKELYVHGPGADPDKEEAQNQADSPAYAQVVADLAQKLRAGWRGALTSYQQQLSG